MRNWGARQKPPIDFRTSVKGSYRSPLCWKKISTAGLLDGVEKVRSVWRDCVSSAFCGLFGVFPGVAALTITEMPFCGNALEKADWRFMPW